MCSRVFHVFSRVFHVFSRVFHVFSRVFDLSSRVFHVFSCVRVHERLARVCLTLVSATRSPSGEIMARMSLLFTSLALLAEGAERDAFCQREGTVSLHQRRRGRGISRSNSYSMSAVPYYSRNLDIQITRRGRGWGRCRCRPRTINLRLSPVGVRGFSACGV